MATIHAFFLHHEAGCDGEVRGGVCSSGCEWQPLPVVARFHPESGSSLRDRIMLARMAALFTARAKVAR